MKAFDTISGAPQPSPLSGLELLSYAVILVDAELAIRHANPAAENLFAISRRNLQGMPLVRLLGRLPELEPALRTALDNNWSYSAKCSDPCCTSCAMHRRIWIASLMR